MHDDAMFKTGQIIQFRDTDSNGDRNEFVEINCLIGSGSFRISWKSGG